MNELRNEFSKKLDCMAEIEFRGAKIPESVHAYIEFLEKRVQALSMSGVVGRSEQFYCAEWNTVGYICEEGQCDKCKKSESM